MFQWNARLATVLAVAVSLAALLGDLQDFLSWGW
jgi:hypothetical protein